MNNNKFGQHTIWVYLSNNNNNLSIMPTVSVLMNTNLENINKENLIVQKFLRKKNKLQHN